MVLIFTMSSLGWLSSLINCPWNVFDIYFSVIVFYRSEDIWSRSINHPRNYCNSVYYIAFIGYCYCQGCKPFWFGGIRFIISVYTYVAIFTSTRYECRYVWSLFFHLCFIMCSYSSLKQPILIPLFIEDIDNASRDATLSGIQICVCSISHCLTYWFVCWRLLS